MQRESEWISSSPKARQAKSKARYQRYEDLLKIANAKQNTVAQITIPVAERLGQNVVDFDHLTKGFGDNLLIDDLTFKLPPGGIVGVIGPNGAGKTTLFRMITGQEKPDKGTIKIGESVHLGYVDQSRDSLDGKKTVWEEISEGNDMILLGKKEMNSRAYCASFNFKGADQQKKVGTLSGGERNRVHLAKMLRSGANLLLLDEPTNDLDVDTLRALEEALEDFAGCAVIISHDRWFLDRIATHILSFEGDSHRGMVRGQLPGLRSRQDAAAGHGQHHPAPAEVQEVFALGGLIPVAPARSSAYSLPELQRGHAMNKPLRAREKPFRLEEATIDELHAAIRAGETTCVDIVRHYLARVRAFNGTSNLLVTKEGAPVRDAQGTLRGGAPLQFPDAKPCKASDAAAGSRQVQRPAARVRPHGGDRLGSGGARSSSA